MNRKNKNTGVRTNEHVDLSKEVSVKSEGELLSLLEGLDNPLLLVLDGIQDPRRDLW